MNLQDVLVLHDVVAADHLLLSLVVQRLVTSQLQQVFQPHHLGADETLGHVAVDLACGLFRGPAVRQMPGCELLVGYGVESDQIQQPLASRHDEVQSGLVQPQTLQELFLIQGFLGK